MKRLLSLTIWMAVACGNAQDVAAGRKEFQVRCSACHGSDGAGGERGPNIVDGGKERDRTKEKLRETIRKGIPEAGMPPLLADEATLNRIVEFVHSLRTPAADQLVPGNREAGKRLFQGAAGCSGCHMIQGAGGISGPDLSNIGRERRLSQIEESIRNPSAVIAAGYKSVTVRYRNRTLNGLVKNESGYDMQLQAMDRSLHSLLKKDIAELVREPGSLMPPFRGTPEQLRDLLAYVSGLSRDGTFTGTPPSGPEGGVTLADLINPKPGNWPTYHGRLNGNRHSNLREIHAGNVERLAPKWFFPITKGRSLQVTPVVVDGVMYVTAANEAYALDARSGRQIWHYSRPLTKGLVGDAASGINRGVAVLGERIFMVTDNAHLLALHRSTGQLLWDVEMADYRQHYGATSAPLVVNDLVISGTSGGDEGARGFLAAYKASTGERAWRFWTMPAAGEPLSETWVGRAIEHGCTTAWLTGTFDPDANLLYWPTGNPCPDYNGDERKGDNLYSNSVLALEPATGKLRWYFQFTPHDLHDWDATETPMLVDTTFAGRPRKLLLQANRNGFFYVLDRVTGQFLRAEPFVKKMTWATGIGPDGRPNTVPEAVPTPGGTKVCPAVEGATNWMSTAFNPNTGLFYVMALEACNIYTKSDAWWKPGESFYGGGTRRVPGETPQKLLRAIDVKTGKIAWELPQTGPANTWGGVLSTEGGLVFFGDDSGALAAADAGTGKPLWHFHTNESWHSSPMTYLVDGKQYIGVSAGSHIIAFGLP
ncbi:MAG TPA: PQQ-dependent dehydrogenase, methanol/ethanol family [Bryobacteraceae bacterium]|nr:PQQ-dependent dehydrogenase, methanol/ethanol family [Bryobacteraceae bacterium]